MLRGGTTCCNENYFFPDVQAGDAVELSYRIVTRLPLFPGKFSDEGSFSRQFPFDRVSITFDVPAGSYYVTELPTDGWGLESIQCDPPGSAATAGVPPGPGPTSCGTTPGAAGVSGSSAGSTAGSAVSGTDAGPPARWSGTAPGSAGTSAGKLGTSGLCAPPLGSVATAGVVSTGAPPGADG